MNNVVGCLTRTNLFALRLCVKGTPSLAGQRAINALQSAGLIDDDEKPTSRGLAALDAPRMTRKQFDMLVRCGQLRDALMPYGGEWGTLRSLKRRGYITSAFCDCLITESGRKALNNVRAALGLMP